MRFHSKKFRDYISYAEDTKNCEHKLHINGTLIWTAFSMYDDRHGLNVSRPSLLRDSSRTREKKIIKSKQLTERTWLVFCLPSAVYGRNIFDSSESRQRFSLCEPRLIISFTVTTPYACRYVATRICDILFDIRQGKEKNCLPNGGSWPEY